MGFGDNKGGISPKLITIGIIAVIVLIIGIIVVFNSVTTVEKGTYHVRQRWVKGTLAVKSTPGMWFKFGSIQQWPKATTFYFTSDTEEGAKHDQSVQVTFNEGSPCRISGSTRVVLPVAQPDQLALVNQKGYTSVSDMLARLILPTHRRALLLTANLMSAQESYAVKRNEFLSLAWDQIQNGVYLHETLTEQVVDNATQEITVRTIKKIKRDAVGNPMREPNPLDGTGIVLENFDIKEFVYDPKVMEQIAKQQEARMAVETAKAKAEEAAQEELRVIADGKRAVAEKQYAKEQEKIQAVVAAQQAKEVASEKKLQAEIEANMRVEVAKLDKQAAEHTKQALILEGEGEAKKKQLIIAADGALQQKLRTYEQVNGLWAKAYSTRKIPQVMMGGSGVDGVDQSAAQFSQAIQLMAMKQIGLDLSVRAK
jgi:regulator of protease activity HflC (stomatin/prohibitin superfamily)